MATLNDFIEKLKKGFATFDEKISNAWKSTSGKSQYEPFLKDLEESVEFDTEVDPSLKDGDYVPLTSPWQNSSKSTSDDESYKETLQKLKDDTKPEDLLSFLNHKDKHLRRKAAKILGQKEEPRAVLPLIHLLEDFNLFVQREAAMALEKMKDVRALLPMKKLLQNFDDEYIKKAFEAILTAAPKRHLNSFCRECFTRCKEFTIVNLHNIETSYYACRNCGSNLYLTPDVDKIILRLDHSLTEPWTLEKRVLTVNWYFCKKPVDLNEIHVKDADETEIEELVMNLKNDMDSKRLDSYNQIPIHLPLGLTYSKAKMNLISDTFTLTSF